MQPQKQPLSLQAQKEKDRLQAKRQNELQKKEQVLNKLSDEEIVVQLKARGLGVYGTKQEKLDRLKKANGISPEHEQQVVQKPQQVVVEKPKGSVVDNIKQMELKREERRNKMEEMKRQKLEREEFNQQQGKNVDLDFELMIEKTRLKEGLIQEHQSTEQIKLCVCVRKRPIFKKEEQGGEIDAVSCSNPMIRVHEPKFKVDGITKYVENHTFQFDNTFSEVEEGGDIYVNALRPILDLLVSQGVVTCFAYGQTGSGKTYTMKVFFYLTNNFFSPQNIQELMVTDLYQLLQRYPQFKMWMSFFEIYSGKCYDLLNNKNPLQILEDKNNNIQIQGLMEKQADTQQELYQLMEYGHSIRTTHATVANDTSSRSHAIIQLVIKNGQQEQGKLILVDLAGSERAQDTQSNNRQRRMEGAEINKSLLALKECIRAMDSAQGHVPFRASKLTLVLRDSFLTKSNKSRIVMIACVSPGSSSADHTLNTLRYADRLKDKTNQPKILAEERDAPAEDFIQQKLQLPKIERQVQAQNQNQIQQNQNQNQNLNQQPLQNQNRNDNNSQLAKIPPKDGKPKSQPVPQAKPPPSKRLNSGHNDKESDSEDQEELLQQQQRKKNVKDDVRCMKETMMKQEKIEENNEFFDFHEKVNTILEEQDEILNIHMAAIKEDAKILTQESELIQSIQGVGIVDYDVDTYVQNLESIIKKKLKIYNLLNKKLSLFKQHLKEEEEISSKMKNTFYY